MLDAQRINEKKKREKKKMVLLLHSWILIIILVINSVIQHSQGKIIGCSVIPHGDFAYDPSLVDNKNGSLKVHIGAVEAGKYIDSLEPDIIILTTPHNIAMTNNFAVFKNSIGTGFAELGDDLHNESFHHKYKIYRNASMDADLSNNFVRKMHNSYQLNVSGLMSFADGQPQELGWGEIIPMSFLSNATIKKAKFIFINLPERRYNHSKEMIPELLNLGKHVFDFFDPLTEKVAFIGSSDLAHTHLKSGPYGYSKYAEPFDQFSGMWANNPKENEDKLLINAGNIEIYAMSCGFPSLVILNGLLRNDWNRWEPKLFANEHPTYYGMLVSIY